MKHTTSSSPAHTRRRVLFMLIAATFLAMLILYANILVKPVRVSNTKNKSPHSSSSIDHMMSRNEEQQHELKQKMQPPQSRRSRNSIVNKRKKRTSQQQAHAHKQGDATSGAATSLDADTDLVRHFLLGATARRAAAHQRLQRGGKPRAAFASLVRHTRDGLTRFVRLLKNVREQLPLMAKRYPFVAFLEDAAPEPAEVAKTMMEISKNVFGEFVGDVNEIFRGGVIFAKIPRSDFGDLPSWVRPESHGHPWPYSLNNYFAWGLGYRHMCRFFGVRVMHQKALAEFDFFLRLDTDSFLLARPRTTVAVPIASDQQEAANPEGSDDDKFGAFFARASKWIQTAHGIPDEELQKAKQQQSNSNNNFKNVDDAESNFLAFALTNQNFRFAELTVDVDLFLEVAAADASYAFDMVHPQTIPQFLHGLWETFDDFAQKHPLSANSAEAKRRRGGDPFHAPRHLSLHFWDNFEILDLNAFRKFSDIPADSSLTRMRSLAARSVLPNKQQSDDNDNDNDLKAQQHQQAHDARATELNQFLEHKDRSGQFYYNRHGDAEFRTMTVTRFFDPTQITYAASLAYQHYHNFACLRGGLPGSLPFAKERGFQIDEIDRNKFEAAADAGDDDESAAAKRKKVLRFAAEKIRRAAAYLRDDVLPKIQGATSAADRTAEEVLVATLEASSSSSSPSSPSSVAVGYHTARALTTLLSFLSDRRLQQLPAVYDECEKAAQAEGTSQSGLQGKGRGSARMLPAEHAPNNDFIWRYVAEMRDGYLPI